MQRGWTLAWLGWLGCGGVRGAGDVARNDGPHDLPEIAPLFTRVLDFARVEVGGDQVSRSRFRHARF